MNEQQFLLARHLLVDTRALWPETSRVACCLDAAIEALDARQRLQAENQRLREALQGIADLIKSDEIMDSSLIDFLGGYDECIKHARKALAFEKRNVPLKQAVEELRAALDGEWIDETQGPANERL